MRADRVEVSWDAAKSQWLVRIDYGAEEIHRRSRAAKDADDATLRSLAAQTVQDEGYDPDPAQIQIRR